MNAYSGTMKRIFFYGVISFLIGMGGIQAEDSIKQIRKWYGEIQNDKNLKKQTFKDGEGDGGGEFELTRYTTAKGELRKIHRYGGGDHGVGNETYYFRGGKLFFVYITSQYWRFTGEKDPNGESEVIDIASQLRLYFKDGKCIKALEKRIAIKGADELRQLLDKQPNKPKEIDDELHSYENRAKQLAAIKSKEDLMKYLSQP